MAKHSRGTFVRLAAGASAASVPFAFPNIVLGQTTRQRLRIASIPSEIGAAVVYGRELGYFDKAGIDVEMSAMSNGSQISAAILSGSLDMGFSNAVSLEIAHDKGMPLTILAGAGMYESKAPTDGIFTVQASSPIHTAKDCNGKTLAVTGFGTITDLSMRSWIDAHGGDSKTPKFIEIAIPLMGPAIISGRVDGGIMDAGGFTAYGGKEKLRQIASTYDAIAPRFVSSFWITSLDFAAKNPAACKAFIGVVRQASAWANAHPKEAVPLFVKNSKYTLEQLTGAVRPTFATKVAPDLIEPTIHACARYGVIKAAFPAKDFMSPMAE